MKYIYSLFLLWLLVVNLVAGSNSPHLLFVFSCLVSHSSGYTLLQYFSPYE